MISNRAASCDCKYSWVQVTARHSVIKGHKLQTSILQWINYTRTVAARIIIMLSFSLASYSIFSVSAAWNTPQKHSFVAMRQFICVQHLWECLFDSAALSAEDTGKRECRSAHDAELLRCVSTFIVAANQFCLWRSHVAAARKPWKRFFCFFSLLLLLLLLLRGWWRTLSHSQSEESQVRVVTSQRR